MKTLSTITATTSNGNTYASFSYGNSDYSIRLCPFQKGMIEVSTRRKGFRWSPSKNYNASNFAAKYPAFAEAVIEILNNGGHRVTDHATVPA